MRILTKSSLMLTDRVLAATGELDELGEDCDGFTPLHLAAAGGNLPTVELVLQQSGIRGGSTDILVNIHATTWQCLTALDIAKQRNHVELVKRLECFDVNWLELERQKSANSVNAILVGAALVGTVAFGCWQQPPLGIPTWDQSRTTNVTARMIQAQQQVQVGWFFMCISVSFSCSVVSLVIGTAASIPSGRGISLKKEGRHLRRSALRASIFLFLAIFFLMFSFQLSGLLVFDAVTPPGTAMHNVGHYILLSFPFFISAYILRFVVLPKNLFRGKRWVLVLYFIMASGFMIGIGFAISNFIALDTRKFNIIPYSFG